MIDLDETEVTAKKIYSGGDAVTITAGQKVDLKVGDTELMDSTVGSGKTWKVHVSVYIEET